MATLEEMEIALARLREEEASLLPERDQLRRQRRSVSDALAAHSARYKVVRDARAELERRVEEARNPRPVSGAVNVIIESAVAEAAAGANAPVVGE